MRIAFVCLLVGFLAACGGGGDDIPQAVPDAGIAGLAGDGGLSRSTVKVYDYTDGRVGRTLATTTTDDQGQYEIALKVESRPVLVEVSGGRYTEAAGPGRQVVMGAKVLRAAVMFDAGSRILLPVNELTHMGAALTEHLVGKAVPVKDAIQQANAEISNWVGFEILGVIPQSARSSGSASPVLSNELKYGFVLASLSQWTMENAPADFWHVSPYTSYDFAQTFYKDIASDGKFDGKGASGTSLGYGEKPITVNILRNEILPSMMRFAGSDANSTGLGATKIKPLISEICLNASTILGDASTCLFQDSVIKNAYDKSNRPLDGTYSVNGVLILVIARQSSVTWNDEVRLSIDRSETVHEVLERSSGSVDGTPFDWVKIKFDLKDLSDGAHSLTIATTDKAGVEASKSFPLVVDNTPPTSTGLNNLEAHGTTSDGNREFFQRGVATDLGAGISQVRNLRTGESTVPNEAGAWRLRVAYQGWGFGDLSGLNVYRTEIEFRDHAGNCSVYSNFNGVNLENWVFLRSYIC